MVLHARLFDLLNIMEREMTILTKLRNFHFSFKKFILAQKKYPAFPFIP